MATITGVFKIADTPNAGSCHFVDCLDSEVGSHLPRDDSCVVELFRQEWAAISSDWPTTEDSVESDI